MHTKDTTQTDWPEPLRLNAAACRLAPAIYYGRAEAFRLTDAPLFEMLDTDVRQQYVTRAAELLRTLEPVSPRTTPLLDICAGIAKEHRDKVIGRISADAPWGV